MCTAVGVPTTPQLEANDSPLLGQENLSALAEHPSENTPLVNGDGRTRSDGRTKSGLTTRAVMIGLVFGISICPTNIYFGLQTGRITAFPLAAALVSKLLSPSLSIAENVVVVAVSTTISAMPMVVALVGVIPAMEYLIEPADGGPLKFGWSQLLLWAIGVCPFGPFLAMRLREHFVLRSQLPFPMAEATALVIRESHAETIGLNLPNRERDGDGDDVGTSWDVTAQEPDQSRVLSLRPECGMRGFIIAAVASAFWVCANFPSTFPSKV